MKQYLDLLERILTEGRHRKDRTGTGTIGVFGHEMNFDMRKGFPLLTTKKVHIKSIIHELLWFLKGSTNIKYLKDNGVTIWDEWCDADGELGPIYGYQWRKWRKYSQQYTEHDQPIPNMFDVHNVDQIADLIKKLHTDPDNRRMMVSAWNVGEIEKMKLPPCHYGFHVSTFEMTSKVRFEWYTNGKNHNEPILEIDFQFADGDDNPECVHEWLNEFAPFVPKRWISLRWEQRSVDTFLGLPFNIASYAILLLMLAQVVNMVPLELTCSLGDTHLYLNHIEQANLQLLREPRELPIMKLNPAIKNIDDFKFEDFELLKYDPHPAIKGDISI